MQTNDSCELSVPNAVNIPVESANGPVTPSTQVADHTNSKFACNRNRAMRTWIAARSNRSSEVCASKEFCRQDVFTIRSADRYATWMHSCTKSCSKPRSAIRERQIPRAAQKPNQDRSTYTPSSTDDYLQH
jgi:hypothetical protein